MVRVKQFADDLGISKNQAKNLINKGRSRKDGGSQILESVMKKPIKASRGKNVVLPKKKPKNFKKTVEEIKVDKALEKGNITIGELNEMTAYDRKQFLKGNSTGTFKDLSGDNKITMKDVLIGRGVIDKPVERSKGGGIAIQGLGFRGVK
jgi:hypothetical protein